MPTTGYDNCMKIMHHIFNRGLDKQVPQKTIEHAIRKEVGIDDRTIDKYVSALTDLGFIRPVNSKVYEIERSPYLYEGYADLFVDVAETFEDAVGREPEAIPAEGDA